MVLQHLFLQMTAIISYNLIQMNQSDLSPDVRPVPSRLAGALAGHTIAPGIPKVNGFHGGMLCRNRPPRCRCIPQVELDPTRSMAGEKERRLVWQSKRPAVGPWFVCIKVVAVEKETIGSLSSRNGANSNWKVFRQWHGSIGGLQSA